MCHTQLAAAEDAARRPWCMWRKARGFATRGRTRSSRLELSTEGDVFFTIDY